MAAVGQQLVAPKTWLGSEATNVLQLLCDLLDLVQQMNTQLAEHTHGASPVPANALAFAAGASREYSSLQSLRLITE